MPILFAPDITDVTAAFSSAQDDYSLLTADQPLDADTPEERVYLCGPCSSALDVGMHLAQRGELAVWDSVLCSRQWAGRGQLRRNWVSMPGNLFAVVRLPFAEKAWENMLSVLVGWSVCKAFLRLGVPTQLKWPNDILLNGQKVGGILIEERGDILLAGIGLNLVSCPEASLLRAEAACPATFLGNVLAKFSILSLWLRLVNFSRFGYDTTLSASTPLEFSQSIEPFLAYVGSRVQVSDNRSSVFGIYSGLSADGGIVLLTDTGRITMHSGSLAPERESDEQI